MDQGIGHASDVSIICNVPPVAVRLAGGLTKDSGRVEVQVDGKWGTVRSLSVTAVQRSQGGLDVPEWHACRDQLTRFSHSVVLVLLPCRSVVNGSMTLQPRSCAGSWACPPLGVCWAQVTLAAAMGACG